MAYYPVTYSCGHSDRVALLGKEKDRERRLKWLEDVGLCPDCWEKKRAEDKAAFEEYKAKTAEEYGLPKLEGTEKQIKWAADIRFKLLTRSEKIINEISPSAEVLLRAMNAYREYALAHESAKWWIDNRGVAYTFSDSLGQIMIERGLQRYFRQSLLETKEMPAEERRPYIMNKVEELGDDGLVYLVEKSLNEEEIVCGVTPIKKEEREAAAEIEAERILSCTLSPESPINERRAIITVSDEKDESGQVIKHRILVRTPERNENVTGLLRYLGYSYNSGWTRTYKLPFEEEDDRIMEIGAKLFQNGFIVELPKPEMVQKIIDGDYKLYNPRQITDREGLFAIRWGSQNFYAEAKKLPGAKWNSGAKAILVPSESYNYILDFAERNKFDLSKGGCELAKAADDLKNKLLVCKEIKMPAMEKPPVPGVIPDLQPIEGQIDESLKDDEAL